MNHAFRFDLACFERSKDGTLSAVDNMGFPVKYEDLQEIAAICCEILTTKTKEQIEKESIEFFKTEYPGMYAQSYCAPKPIESMEDREYKKNLEALKLKKERRPLQRVAGKTSKPGFVYLAYNPVTKLHKIGLTRNVAARLRGLKSSVSKDVKIVHSFPVLNMGKSEDYFHSMFIDKQVYHEWFDLGESDVNYIKSIGGVA